MKLYHCTNSRSTRVVWLMEELGLDYELEVMPFDRAALQAPDYLAISPFGKVPALVDGTVSMFESVAIIKYILDRYADGRLQPASDSDEYGRFLQWMEFGESTMMGPVSIYLTHKLFLPEEQRDDRARDAAMAVFTRYAGVLDGELADDDYLVGNEFTAADIVVGYVLFLARKFGCFPDDVPHLAAYYQRLEQRPAFQAATD